MSYSSGNSAMGVLGGIGSVLLICMVVGLRIGLKVMARASRNYDYSQSQVDNNPGYNSMHASHNPYINPPPITIPSPSYSSPNYAGTSQADYEAAEAARRERQAAEYAERERQRVEAQAADQARREAAAAAAREAQQRFETERLARSQEQETRMRELRERSAAMANQPAFVPAPAAPAFVPAPAPAAPVVDENAVPGFAPTNIAQIKVKDYVFVQSQDGKWYPAMVQSKRGLVFRIRYSTNGLFDMVTADRIRLKTEPAEEVAGGPPVALQPVAPPRQAGKAKDEEDDAAFVAKPKKDDEEAPSEPVAATPMPTTVPEAVADPPAAANLRTWTNDTGEFKVQAELLSFEFDIVRLKRADGKILNLPIEKLSLDDQAIVRKQFP